MTRNSQNFEIDLKNILNTYKSDVAQVIRKAQEETAQETVQELKSTSPKRSGKYGGKYAKGWTATQEGRTMVVHNKRYQVTHLLENGHANRNGGRTRAYPHIGPANEHAVESFQDKIEKGLNDA